MSLCASTFLLCTLPLGTSTSALVCPDVQAHETDLDCPWAGVARALITAADEGKALGPVLHALAPGLEGQLASDRAARALLALWGESQNRDEAAHATIVDRRVAALLTALASVEPNGAFEDAAHAGVLHTYGYLLSLIDTPFGHKRDRWTQGKIEEGLGLPPGTLGPMPPAGTLLQNLTYLLATISLAERTDLVESLAAAPVPRGLKQLDAKKLSVRRLEERVSVEPPGQGFVVLRTDFVRFAHGVPGGHLLIYSVSEPTHPLPRLITAFPVDEAFVSRALDPSGLGANVLVKSRYNARVPGLTPASRAGSRRVLALSGQ